MSRFSTSDSPFPHPHNPTAATLKSSSGGDTSANHALGHVEIRGCGFWHAFRASKFLRVSRYLSYSLGLPEMGCIKLGRTEKTGLK